MANETASLVIVVDSTSAKAATEQLDLLTAAGARAQAAVGALGDGAAQASSSVSEVTQAVTDASSGMATVVDAGAAVEASVTKAAEATVAMGESADAASLRIKAMVAASLEQVSANGIVGESETSLAERAGLRIEATEAQIAATQAAAAAQDAQMVSTEGFFGAENAATVATEANTVATEANAAAYTLNSRMVSEAGTLLTEVATGQFGRVRRSFAAMMNASGLLGKLFTPMGAAIAGSAAAIGIFITALVQGAEEEDKLNSAIIATGNYAGVTTGQVQNMARSLTRAGTSTMQATDMLTKIIATGKVSGDALQDVAQASLDLARITGESADKTSAVFIKMQGDPVKAVKELDDQLHFLTLTQYESIKALQEQGDTEIAASIAQTAASQAVHERALEVDSNVGLMARAWDNLESKVKSAWGAMAHVGVQDSSTTDLANINSQLDAYRTRVNAIRERTGQPLAVTDADLSNAGEVSLSHDKIVSLIQQKYVASLGAQMDAWVAGTESANAKANDVLKKDSDRWDAILKGAKSDQAKAKEIADIKAMTQRDIAANPNNRAEYLKNEQIGIAEINKKYKPPKVHKSPEVSALSTFQGQVDSLSNKVVGPTDDAALAKYETGIAKLSDELNKYMSKSGDATKGAQLFNEGQQALQKTLDKARASQKEADDAFAAGYAQKSLALQRSVQDQVDAIGMGTKEAAQAKEVTQAYRDQADELAKLGLQLQKGQNGESGGITQAQYDADVAVVKAATDKNVATMQDGFKRIDAAQGSWLNGAKTAMKDYADAGQNAAGLMQSFTTNAFTSMSDALANFVTTGKLNFTSLSQSILSGLIKIETQILVSKALSSIFGGTVSGAGTNTYNSMGGISHVSFNADGGAYSSPSLSAYSNQIVSSPTMFAFANGGSVGVMGEVPGESEAIMPLTRGANGKLGVQASGSGDVEVFVNITNNGQAVQAQQTGVQQNGKKVIVDMVLSAVTNDIARGGNTSKAIQQRFGLQRRGVATGNPA